MADPTFYIRDAARDARQLEVPDAAWGNGLNNGGSNSPGIGINIDGGPIVDEPQQFTVLDQDGDPRTPQVGQHISGAGHVAPSAYPSSGGLEGKGTVAIEAGTPSASGNGGVAVLGDATLTDAATGWTVVVPP